MTTCRTCGGAMLSEQPHHHPHGELGRIVADDLLRFGITSPAIERDRTQPTPDPLRVDVVTWVPQHAAFCARQPEDTDCVCGVGPEYERLLAAAIEEADRG